MNNAGVKETQGEEREAKDTTRDRVKEGGEGRERERERERKGRGRGGKEGGKRSNRERQRDRRTQSRLQLKPCCTET